MREPQQTIPNAERHGACVFEGAIPFILAHGSFQFSREPIPPHDEGLEAGATLGAQTMRSLLVALFRHCADIYAIRDHLNELLEIDQHQACHHVLLLLYAACQEPVPAGVVAIIGRVEMLPSFFQGVMLALDDWLKTQEALWRREVRHAE